MPQPAASSSGSGGTGTSSHALIAANICAQCGEALCYSAKTGEKCAPSSKDMHFHEKKIAGTLAPICCKCIRAAGIECTVIAAATATDAVQEAVTATEEDGGDGNDESADEAAAAAAEEDGAEDESSAADGQ